VQRSKEKFSHEGFLYIFDKMIYRRFLDMILGLRANMNPDSISCDYEIVLFNTVSVAFPNAEIFGCFFSILWKTLRSASTATIYQPDTKQTPTSAYMPYLCGLAHNFETCNVSVLWYTELRTVVTRLEFAKSTHCVILFCILCILAVAWKTKLVF